MGTAHRVKQLSFQDAGLGQQLALARAQDVGRVCVQAARAAHALYLAQGSTAPGRPQRAVNHLQSASLRCGSEATLLAGLPAVPRQLVA